MNGLEEFIIIPEITIDRETYTVSICEDLKDHGNCDYDSKVIAVSKDKSKVMISTFLHEVVHALDHEYQIGLHHRQVYALEKALFYLLADNYFPFEPESESES